MTTILSFRLGLLAALTIAISPNLASAQMMHGHGAGHHGADGTGHDMVTMPGLQGANASPEESADLMVLFHHFASISREVENLPNGIRTVTSSSDPYVFDALTRHVRQMISRVEAGDDPQIIIQSPTLDIFFARYTGLTNTIEMTEMGIVVVQTSDDPDLVAALHSHAAEVSDMTARGMQAVHERMMHGG